MASKSSVPNKIKEVEIKARGLALADSLRGAAEALAAELSGSPARVLVSGKTEPRYPFEMALAQQFREREIRFGTLLDGAPVALILADRNGVILLANVAAGQLFGIDREVLVGKSISAVLAGPMIEQLMADGPATLSGYAEEPPTEAVELSGMRQNGTGFACEASLALIADGEDPAICLSLRDSTTQRAKERRLTEASDRLRQLLDAMPDAIVALNRAGRIVEINTAGEVMLGTKRQSALGRPAPDSLVVALVGTEAEPISPLGGPDDPSRTVAVSADGSRANMEARLGTLVLGGKPITVADLRRSDPEAAQGAADEAGQRAQIIEALPEALLAVEANGTIAFANARAEALFGFEPGMLKGRPVGEVVPDGIAERLKEELLPSAEMSLAQELGAGIELTGRRKNGTLFPLEVMLGPASAPSGRRLIATLRDITLRRAAEQHAPGPTPTPSFEETAEDGENGTSLADATLDSIGDALISADPSGKVCFLNRAAEVLTGWAWADAAGRPVESVLRVAEAGSRVTFGDLAGGPSGRSVAQLHPNLMLIRRNGTQVPIEGSVAPIDTRDGRNAGTVLVFRDASLSRAEAQQMAHSAQHDALTGLPNRVLLHDRITRAISIAPRHAKRVAVLFLDLDGFKQINDRLGHAVGDKLLKIVAERLGSCVRGSDTVSRMGGDEFVVLLTEVERPEDSAITARRMLEAVSEPYVIDHHELRVTVSVGVSTYPEDGNDADMLIRNADAAMYQAKENGRHGYQFYKPAMNLRAIERQDVEESLRRAVDRNEFTLHFQPKVSLQTGAIAGAEALLRWDHPTRGPMSPSLFLPVAEQSGLIHPIGQWVLREACRQVRDWQQAGLRLPSIAINVSAAEFLAPHFLDHVFETLNDTGLDPRALELELTEHALMSRAEAASPVLEALSASGIQMSVDDFGTGYSSLNNLRKFPINMLKIDQSFVREITLTKGAASLVSAVLNMAQSLDLRVVAEGVETPEELAFLQEHHCDEAQGYYFSRPLPAAQFATLLRDGLLATMANRRYGQGFGRLQSN